jgi:hypothetical protein
MWYGYFDRDRRIPARAKLDAAIAEYVAQYGCNPTVCLTSFADADALEREGATLPVRRSTFLYGGSFYVGEERARR